MGQPRVMVRQGGHPPGRSEPGELFCAMTVGKGALKEAGPVAVVFDEATRELLDRGNFAAVATLNPDGGPQTSVVWILRDGDTVLFSTTAARRKALNVARDPRVSLTVFETENPYHSVEIRGTAELVEDKDKSLPKALSRKYLGEDPPPEPDEVTRLIVRVTPHRINIFSV
jgi:PPOX class probable F420-dependent enzyme